MSTIINATTTNGVVIQPDNSGSLVLQTNSGTTALTIDTSQNVGIGTISPAGKLETKGTGAVQQWLTSSSTAQYDGAYFNLTTSSASTNYGQTSFQHILNTGAGDLTDTYLAIQQRTTAGAYVGNIYQYSYKNQTSAFYTNNTERMRIDSSGNLLFDSGYGSVATAYGCRAWVNFNGTGTPAIRASGNVTSITDHAVGKYTINFTTAMPDANYSVAGSALHTDGTGFAMTVSLTSLATPVAGSCRISVAVPTVGFADPSVVDVAVFR
jgi:hypothetical protein